MVDLTERRSGSDADHQASTRGNARIIAPAVVLLVLLQVLAFVGPAMTSSAHLALDVVAAAGGIAALPLLMKRPVLGGVVLGLLAALSPAATPTATCAVFVVAQVRSFPVAASVAGVGVAAHIGRGIWRPVEDLPFGWWVLLVLVAYATLVGWGAFVQARRALLLSLRERAERAESEQARRIVEVRMLERTRIAREMHDVLAHRLSLLATYAGALEYRPDAPPERLSAAAGVVRAGAHQALEELRQVIGVLREEDAAEEGIAVATPQPTLAQLPDLVEENRAAGLDIEVRQSGLDASTVPTSIGRTAYRVIQEAMTNARRHAPGQPVHVSVVGALGNTLEVEVSNPIDPTASRTHHLGAGFGLIGLAERVQLAGGELEHARTRRQFRLTARLPLTT